MPDPQNGEPTHLTATAKPGVYLGTWGDQTPAAIVRFLETSGVRPGGIAASLAPLTLEQYEEARPLIERDEILAVEELTARYPWAARWYADIVADSEPDPVHGPPDAGLWQADEGHPEHTIPNLRAAYHAARLRFGQLHNDQMEVLFRWAWQCELVTGQHCVDAPRNRQHRSDHEMDHGLAFRSARRAWCESFWPMHHWIAHLFERRCVLVGWSRPADPCSRPTASS